MRFGMLTWLVFFFIIQLSQANQDFEISQDNYGEFADHVLCNYDVSISYEVLDAFLSTLLEDPFAGCEDIEPLQMVSSPGTASYRWSEVPNAIGYRAASIGLTDGLRTFASFSETNYSFTDLVDQEYMFVFLVDCEEGSSIASILIVDGDIHDPDSYAEDSDCHCGVSAEEIEPNEICPSYVSYAFPWNNACPSHKYYFQVGEGENYYTQITLKYEEIVDGPNQVTINEYCTNFLEIFGYEMVPFIADEDKFMALFTAEAAYIYLFDPNLFLLPVSASNCGCVEGGLSGDDKRKVGQRGSLMDSEEMKSKMIIAPNPFSNQFTLKFDGVLKKSPAVRIYSMDGQLILPNLTVNPGNEELLIDGSDLTSGVYHLQLEIGDQLINQRIVKL